MIIDSDSLKLPHTTMVNSHMPSSSESPPSYDLATSYQFERAVQPTQFKQGDGKGPATPKAAVLFDGAGPSRTPQLPPTTVYYYQHPVTGDRITSLLPPDHPEMVCLQQGAHLRETKFGLLGILAAMFWFPLGVGLCLLDRKVRCRRCGLHIEEGVFG